MKADTHRFVLRLVLPLIVWLIVWVAAPFGAWAETTPPAAPAAGGVATSAATAATDAPGALGKVTYRKGKDVNFDELMIQGSLKRPEVTVVTGNAAQGADGLLRLRENFIDQSQMEIGEEIR